MPDIKQPPIKHYLKEIVSNPIYDTDGRPIPFEPLAEGYGVIALLVENENDAKLIKVLDSCVNKKIGGVMPITADTYSKKKKSLPFVPTSQETPLRAFPSAHQPPSVRAQNAAADKPVETPEASFAMGGRTNTNLPNPAQEQSAAVAAAPPATNFKPRTGRSRALTKSAEKALAAAGA